MAAAGRSGLLPELKEVKIEAFIDRSQKVIDNYIVYSPEEAVNLENEMIDEWIVFRWKRVYPADVFLKFPADDWEKELIETFAGYSHEEIDLERYRKKDRAKF